MKRPPKPVWAIIAIESYVEELESYVRELEVQIAKSKMTIITTAEEAK